MALKNTQYDTIMRAYNRRQLDHKRNQNARISEAYAAAPLLSEIDAQIAVLSVRKAKRLLSGDDTALDSLKDEIAVLSRKRTAVLKANGFPSDYLDMHYTCPDCLDTGYTGNVKCHCFKQAVIDLLYTQSNIRDILERENFQNFCYDFYSETMINPATGHSALTTIRQIVAECKQFIHNFDEICENIFLYGDTGVGKTFLSHCIANELLETSHSVIYFTSFELFDLFSKATFQRYDNDKESQQMHTYIFDCDLLIIDDLGTELTNSFVSSQLFLCINERLLRKKSTLISTNLSLDVFRDIYSERTFSRISSNYMMRKVIGDDIRIKKKLSGGGA